jgi:hypothetical protein
LKSASATTGTKPSRSPYHRRTHHASFRSKKTNTEAGRSAPVFTHLDRVYWPEAGLTKGDLVEYYSALAPVLLPHLRNRPFTIKRHYTVPRGPFVWEKDAPPEMPDWIRVAPLPAKSRRGAPVRYPLVNDVAALLWMVEYGCVDLHVWTSRADRPERPDYGCSTSTRRTFHSRRSCALLSFSTRRSTRSASCRSCARRVALASTCTSRLPGATHTPKYASSRR